MIFKEIIKLSQAKHDMPHYRYLAYSQISGIHNDIVVLFGFTPIVDEDDATIIVDDTNVWVGWKALINDRWYGDFATVENNKEDIDNALDTLYIQAKESIKGLLQK